MIRQNIHEMVSQAADRFSEKVAIERADRSITYRELEERSNSLANYLVANGAGRGSVVAILMDESIEAVTAMLGCLKAQSVFVHLEASLPDKRLEAMLSLASPDWYIIETRFFKSLARAAGAAKRPANVIAVADGCAETDSDANFVWKRDYGSFFDKSSPARKSDPDDMCYIYFTSGSTGTPKAIAGRLKGIDHFIRWETKHLGLNDSVRASQLLMLSFDGSLRDIFVPLSLGGTVCVPTGRDTILDTRKLIDWIESRQINLIHCVPSLFRSITNEKLNPEQFHHLKHILLTGEPLLPSDVGRWVDVFGDRVQLLNLYGTSETTMAKFCYTVKPSDKDRRAIPVGKPIEGAAAILMDEKGRLCPPGVIGEIYIRTPYRTHGYYNQPELTNQVFIQNPFSDDATDIIYKTGDIGRVLEDGNFEVLGRRDGQVKIRGLRVELFEIENLLRGHEAIKDVAVVEREDSSGYNYLCAYIVLAGGSETDGLRQYLGNYLPDYMLPSQFVVMERLPRTLTGKIDRRALPDPARLRTGLERNYVAPRTPVEEALAGVWSSLLGIERVGIQDNFFEVGGHSLLGTQLLSRVRSSFDVELPLRALFNAPTLGGLALAITKAQVEQQDEQEMARIIAEIQALSGDELDTLLGQQTLSSQDEETI